jgi:hypothetical protein
VGAGKPTQQNRLGKPENASPIAITDLTRPSPPKFSRVAIEHPPACPVGDYKGAPRPANEDERQEYLCGLNVLDTPADSRFDDITKLVCHNMRERERGGGGGREREGGREGQRERASEYLGSLNVLGIRGDWQSNSTPRVEQYY